MPWQPPWRSGFMAEAPGIVQARQDPYRRALQSRVRGNEEAARQTRFTQQEEERLATYGESMFTSAQERRGQEDYQAALAWQFGQDTLRAHEQEMAKYRRRPRQQVPGALRPQIDYWAALNAPNQSYRGVSVPAPPRGLPGGIV